MKLLLERGASTSKRNHRKETPIDVVSGSWNEGLADVYRYFDKSADLDLDMKAIEQDRPKIARLLREHAKKGK